MKKKYFSIFVLFFLSLVISGCQSSSGNKGQLQSYLFNIVEPDWIRYGDPIIFENESWYPQDGIETFLDQEVLLMGEYKGVQFFVDKIDVRPFDRLYTKFGKNKFRYFEKRNGK